MSNLNNEEKGGVLRIADGPLVGELQEAKRTWYTYVLESLEKIRETVGLLITDYNTFKIEIITRTNSIVEGIKDSLHACKDHMEDRLRSTEIRLDRELNVIDDRLDKIETVNCVEGLRQNSALRGEFSDLKIELDKQLQPIRIRIIKLETRLVLWSTLFGMVGSGFIGILAYILKDYVSAAMSK